MKSEEGEAMNELRGEQLWIYLSLAGVRRTLPSWQVAVGRGEEGSFHQSFGRQGVRPWLCH